MTDTNIELKKSDFLPLLFIIFVLLLWNASLVMKWGFYLLILLITGLVLYLILYILVNYEIFGTRVFWILLMILLINMVEPFESDRDRVYQDKQECIELHEGIYGSTYPGQCDHYDTWADRASDSPSLFGLLISLWPIIFIINPEYSREVFSEVYESK